MYIYIYIFTFFSSLFSQQYPINIHQMIIKYKYIYIYTRYIQILSYHVPSNILPLISNILIFSIDFPPNPPGTWELPSRHGLRRLRGCSLRGAHRQPRLVEAHEIRSLQCGTPRWIARSWGLSSNQLITGTTKMSDPLSRKFCQI